MTIKAQKKEYFSPIQDKILERLEVSGSLTRRDLVRVLNTPRTTIYNNLVKLEKRKLVEKISRSTGNRGRPLIFWKIKK